MDRVDNYSTPIENETLPLSLKILEVEYNPERKHKRIEFDHSTKLVTLAAWNGYTYNIDNQTGLLSGNIEWNPNKTIIQIHHIIPQQALRFVRNIESEEDKERLGVLIVPFEEISGTLVNNPKHLLNAIPILKDVHISIHRNRTDKISAQYRENLFNVQRGRFCEFQEELVNLGVSAWNCKLDPYLLACNAIVLNNYFSRERNKNLALNHGLEQSYIKDVKDFFSILKSKYPKAVNELIFTVGQTVKLNPQIRNLANYEYLEA